MNISLKILEEQSNECYVVKAAGDLIITNASQLQNTLDQAIGDGQKNIQIDLTEIQYIDSFGMGVIVKTKSELDKQKGRFSVLVNPTLFTLFQKCHLDNYIQLETIE